MKIIVFFLLISCLGKNCFAQTFQLHLVGNSIIENKIIDSIGYKTSFSSTTAVTDEINFVFAKLSQDGYLNVQQLESRKINESNYYIKLSLAEKIQSVHIYLGKNKQLLDILSLKSKKDTLSISYGSTQSFLAESLQKLEQKGFGFAKLSLVNIKKKSNAIHADLQFELGQQRQLNKIVVKFEENSSKHTFPTGHLKQINRKYNKNTFNQDLVRKIENDFNLYEFINQIKKPEVLFTKDTTKVYAYVAQKKSNTFDGFLGFTNNDNNKLTFNGYLDLNLVNAIHAGEQLSIYWKNNGEEQKTFKASVEIPYILKTTFGLKAELTIFKQDSIFQNTKTNINLGYLLDYNNRIYIGYQATASSDIQNTNSQFIKDYNNSFITANFEYVPTNNVIKTFTEKTKISFACGLGTRSSSSIAPNANKNRQSFISLNGTHSISLNPKNYININYQNYFLKSNTYVVNELYRFGGTKSIRGFAENSLQANFIATVSTEYRYTIAPDLYVHSIFDYAYYEDKTANLHKNIIGMGFGAGLRTNNGYLRFSISNGINPGQTINFQNSIIAINYEIEF